MDFQIANEPAKGMAKSQQSKIIFIIMSVAAVLIAFTISAMGMAGAAMILILVLGLPGLYAIIAYPKFGIITIFISAYFVMFVVRLRLVDFPLGTVMDFLQVLLIIGFFIKQKYRPDWSFTKDPLGIVILLWVLYNIFEVLNPVASSTLAWLYSIRAVAAVMLFYFIFVYQITDVKFLRLLFKIWIGLTIFAALYACKQEFIGFSHFEEIELSDRRVRALLFIGGIWRKFSIFSDPVAFAYNMVSCSLFCLAMLFGPIKIWKKVILALLVIFFLYAMLLSGTRGAYPLVPAAVVLLTILKFNKRILILAIFGGIVFLAMLNISTGNPTVRRFQSAFKPSNDASYNVRATNQKRIQPFIQSHPFGGGLGATGVMGARFAPGSFLAGFPPDSGYVRVAVEVGWIGLLLLCTFFFILLLTGINNYYRIVNPELKTYCLAMVLVIFAYAIGNYPQEALTQFPSNIYFYLFAAIIVITMKLDKERLKAITKPDNT